MQKHCTDCKNCKQIDTIKSGKYTNFIFKCQLPGSTYLFPDHWKITEALTCKQFDKKEEI